MSAGLVFKPRARLILQLGDQLIKNEGIDLSQWEESLDKAENSDIEKFTNEIIEKNL